MNEYLFFTPEGTTIAPNANIEVENCQLLGRVRASCVDEARIILLEENPWIEEAGFSTGDLIQEQIITEEQLSSIQEIIKLLQEIILKSSEIGIINPTNILTGLKSLNEMVSDHTAVRRNFTIT